MRSILGTAALLLIGLLTACGGGGGDEVKSTKTASPTPARFIACDLLTKKQRETAVGAKVDFQGHPDEPHFPAWSCVFTEARDEAGANEVSYRAVRARVWAQKFPDILDSLPEDQKPRDLLAYVLQKAGVAEKNLASMEDDAACDLWAVFQKTLGATVVGDTTSWSETHDDFDVALASASTCSQGIYADIRVTGPDADSRAGRERAETALSAIYENAFKRLPQ